MNHEPDQHNFDTGHRSNTGSQPAIAGHRGGLVTSDAISTTVPPAGAHRHRHTGAVKLIFASLALLSGGALSACGGSEESSAPSADSASSADLHQLVKDPSEGYSVELDQVPVQSTSFFFGGPEHVGILTKVPDSDADTLRVFDATGAEQWSYDFNGSAGLFPVKGDYLAVDPVGAESADTFEMAMLDGATGAERWSRQVGPVEQVAIVDDRLVVADSGHVRVYSVATGKNLASGDYNWVSDTLRQTVNDDGKFVVWKDEELFVLDTDLNKLSEPIPMAAGGRVSYLNDQVLVIEGGELTRYGLDGEPAASAEFRAEWAIGVEGSTWLFGTAGKCGAFDFSGDEIKELWTEGGCSYREHARLDDRTYYVVVKDASGGDVLRKVASGDEVKSSSGRIRLYSNGYMVNEPSTAGAYAIGGGDELFSQPTSDSVNLIALDGGYVSFDLSGSVPKLTTYS